jgi:hypothetical protein
MELPERLLPKETERDFWKTEYVKSCQRDNTVNFKEHL